MLAVVGEGSGQEVVGLPDGSRVWSNGELRSLLDSRPAAWDTLASRIRPDTMRMTPAMDLRLNQQPGKQISLNLTLNIAPSAKWTPAETREVAGVIIDIITDELEKD
jgi:hypothetical protein